MSATDTAPESAGLDDRIERCRRVLEALTDKAMGVVEALDPHDPAVSIGETALAFSRLSRAVRLNILLDLRLDEVVQGGAAVLQAERAQAERAETAPAALDDGTPEAAEPAEPRDRLDREAPDEALRWLKRPITDMVAAICKGLRLSPEETAQAQAPFAALVANDDGPAAPPACRTAGVSPASVAAPRPRTALKARLLGGSAGACALGP
jgi:hypothetical protein